MQMPRLVTGLVAITLLAGALGACAGSATPPTDRKTSSLRPATTLARPLEVNVHERWRTAVLHPFLGLPAVDDRGIVVTAGEAEVIALSPDGQRQWTTPVTGALVRAPRLDGDLVFVAAKRAVVALDRATGKPVWSVPTAADGAPDDRVNRPVVVREVVVASTAKGRVLALDRATGLVRWDMRLPTASTSEPAAIDDVVTIVGIGEWTALSITTGAVAWSADIGILGTSSPVTYRVGNHARAALATHERVVAVDAATGAVEWMVDAPQSEFFQVPLVTSTGELLVPDHWGRVTAYRGDSGARLWATGGPDEVAEFGEPVSLGGTAVVISLDGGPRVATPEGALALRPPARGHGAALLGDGRLVVTTWGPERNYVVAYDLDVGVRPPTR